MHRSSILRPWLAGRLLGVTGRLAFDAQGEMKNPALTFSRFVDAKKTPLN